MGQSSGCCAQQEQFPVQETVNAIQAAPEFQEDDDVRKSPGSEEPEESISSHRDIEMAPRLPSLEMKTEIMRGISLRKCLRHVRQLWWQSPIDLDPGKRQGLWKTSRPVTGFDIFLSHTWKTSGLLKCLALSLQSTWMWCLATWLLTMILLVVLYTMRLLPMSGSYRPAAEFSEELLPLGAWMTVFSLPSCVIGLLLAMYLPERIWTSPTCFLDAVSINQSDPGLMMDGVYGLGGFLQASKELRILWSRPYFSRLWCIFELAAYRTANPDGRVTIAPVFVESEVAAYFFANYLNSLFFIDREAFVGLSIALQLLSTFFLVRYLRRSLVMKRLLLADLRNFDVDVAECRLQCDRDFVMSAITQWFGNKEAFTEYVRTSLGEAVTSGFSVCLIPLQYQILIATPEVSLNLDSFMSMCLGEMPTELLVSHFLAMVLGYAVCWRMACVSLVVRLCDMVPSYVSWKMAILDVLIFLIGNFCIVSGLNIGQAAYSRGVPYALAWFVFSCLVACFFQGHAQTMWRLARAGRNSKK